MKCDKEPIFLGCFPHCGDIILPIVALNTGMHIITYSHSFNNNTKYNVRVFAKAGLPIVLRTVEAHFNESAKVNFSIKNPDGSQYVIILEEGKTSCFCLQTQIHYDANLYVDTCKKLLDACGCENDCNTPEEMCNYILELTSNCEEENTHC